MHITTIPCLSDNYSYLLHAADGSDGIVVDPSEASAVVRVLQAADVQLSAVLCTHHHWDHIGGVERLIEDYGPVPVFGHVSDRGRIPRQTDSVEDGDQLDLGRLRFRVLHVPGHTRGSVAYLVQDAVFTGDTLFVAGCGRLFEGTAAQMYDSLNRKLGALPDTTRVYCAHEYTAQNLKFARTMEPSNEAIRAKATRVAEQRQQGEPTVPSSIGEERETNPFMRIDSPELRSKAPLRERDEQSPEVVFAAVRSAKDRF